MNKRTREAMDNFLEAVADEIGFYGHSRDKLVEDMRDVFTREFVPMFNALKDANAGHRRSVS